MFSPDEASGSANETTIHPVLQARSLGGSHNRSSSFAVMFCEVAVNAEFANPDPLLLGKYRVRLSSHNSLVKSLIHNLVLYVFLFKGILFFSNKF